VKYKRKKKKFRISWVNTVILYPFMLLYYLFTDLATAFARKHFVLYGVTLYVGPVGAGKTMGMVERALRLKRRDENIIIWSNFEFEGVDYVFEDLSELANVPSYSIILISEGALFANARDWRDFPVGVIELLTQNRKWGDTSGGRPPGVMLLWDVQDPHMIDTNVRRLTNQVAYCTAHCDFGNGPRLMLQHFYRPAEYFSRTDPTQKLKRTGFFFYMATDGLRRAYNTYQRLHSKKG